MKHHKFSKIIPLLIACIFLAGCPKDPYRAAIQGSDTVAQSVKSAIDIAVDVHAAGLISDNEFGSTLHIVDYFNTVNAEFLSAVKQIHASGETGPAKYLETAAIMVDKAQRLSSGGFPGISNDKVRTALLTIKTAIDGVALSIQKARQ